MAFNLYFAGADPKADDVIRQRKGLRLFSQTNEMTRILKWHEDGYGSSLFVDSGAFSVAHSGKYVDIDKYIEFINNYPDIRVFAELDVIPYPVLNKTTARTCAEKSWENYVYMQERIITDSYILPLYHFGEPKESLMRILETPVKGKLASYIGIGGRHGVSMDLQEQYFHEIFSMIQRSKNPKVKVHVFGMTVLRVLEKYPFYSADSTTWLQLALHANIFTRCAGNILVGSKQSHAPENFCNFPREVKDKILAEVEQFGFTMEQLSDDLAARMQFNVQVFQDWADEYQYKGPKSFISHRLF